MSSRSVGSERARAGDLVLVRPSKRGSSGEVARVLGRPDVARDVIGAFLLERGMPGGFDPAVEREARDAARRVAGDSSGRRDLRELPTFTVDPATARDFDDAISAERLPDGGTRVWVHIADVAAHVREGSLVDREAQRRATSVYVPGAVEPMLPHALSSDACSLLPGQRAPSGHGGARAGGCARGALVLLPIARAFGRTPRLRARGSCVRRSGERRGAMGAGARSRARGRRGARAPARGARRPRDRRRGARVRVRRARQRARRPRAGADRVAPAHRAPDDRRQRGGRRAARAARDPVSVPRARAAGPAAHRTARRAARLARGADAAAARATLLDAGGRPRRGDLAARRAPRAAHRPRAIALESLVLRSLKQAYYSPATSATRACTRRATATSPRRSAATRT